MSKAPLMFGGELRDNDAWTLSLLTNRRVLAIPQSSKRQLSRDGDRIIWTAQGDGSRIYAALFNLGDEPDTLTLDLSGFSPSAEEGAVVRQRLMER